MTQEEKAAICRLLRKETACGLMTALEALNKLIEALKNQPPVVMDSPNRIIITWENGTTQEEKQLFNEYVKAEKLEKQPLTDAQRKCNHRWYKTWTWHSGGFQKCSLCGRVETFYERD